MNYRNLGNSDLKVSEVSFGTWAIGGGWGEVTDEESLKALHYAIEAGVNFFDTADVYGAGHSEELLAKATKGKHDKVHIATKFCRWDDYKEAKNYTASKIKAYCEASLRRLEREQIDLLQIHCPPTEILREGSVFTILDKLQNEGKIRHYGVSVESDEQGLLCMKNSNVRALQIIFNLFRQKPITELLPVAKSSGVGILVRLPLASGLLAGKFTAKSQFAANDHRSFNRNGENFNVGETFAGLPFAKGVELSQQLAWIAEGRGNMAQASLRWILDQEGISCVIPGFKNVKQVTDNLKAMDVPTFTASEQHRLHSFYQEQVRSHIRGPY